MAFGEEVDERVLSMIGVLVLINQNILKKLSVSFECLGKFTEEPKRKREEIVEIERMVSTKLFLIASVGFGDKFLIVASGLGFKKKFINKLVFGARDGVEERARMDILGINLQGFHNALHEGGLIVAVENGERRLVAQSGDVLSQNPRANTMKSSHVGQGNWEWRACLSGLPAGRHGRRVVSWELVEWVNIFLLVSFRSRFRIPRSLKSVSCFPFPVHCSLFIVL